MTRFVFIFSVSLLLAAVFFAVKIVLSDKINTPPLEAAYVIKPQDLNISENYAIKVINKIKTQTSLIADEYELSWDLLDPLFAKIIIYSLAYKDKDKFEFSCIKQVLEDENVTYDLKQTSAGYDVFVNLEQKIKAEKIYKILEDYDINGSYSESFQIKENLYDEK